MRTIPRARRQANGQVARGGGSGAVVEAVGLHGGWPAGDALDGAVDAQIAQPLAERAYTCQFKPQFMHELSTFRRPHRRALALVPAAVA